MIVSHEADSPALDLGLQVALPYPLRVEALHQLLQLRRVVTDEPEFSRMDV